VIFDAALALDTDPADLSTQHLATTTRHLEAIAPETDAGPSDPTRSPTDHPGPGGVEPVR
jgi:hypothetical protein